MFSRSTILNKTSTVFTGSVKKRLAQTSEVAFRLPEEKQHTHVIVTDSQSLLRKVKTGKLRAECCMRHDVAPVIRMADELAQLPANFNMFRLPPISSLGDAEVHSTDKEFRVRMDMPYFKPDDVKISSENGRLIVHAKHAEKQDQHGYVEREFTRVFKLPKDVDSKCVTATMNDQGVLNFKIPKKALEEPKETKIPVNYTED